MTTITVKVAKMLPFGSLSEVPEGIFASDDRLMINWHSDIVGYGLAHALVELGDDCFQHLAQAMMSTNADAAIRAFGRALQDGIPRPSN